MSGISIIAYLIITLSIGYAFVYPSYQDLNQLLDQKQKQTDSLEMMKNIENRKNELLTEFNKIPEVDKKSIDTVLPNSFNFVKLISQIDVIAAGHGISIDKITSKEIDSAVGTSIDDAKPQKPYQSAIIGFSFVTSYDSFRNFVDNLEKSLRILDIRTVKLESKKDGLYSYTVEFETYWLKQL